MKILVLLLVSLSSFAGGFFPVGKPGKVALGYHLHETEAQCHLAEGVPCYDIDACPLDECDLVNGRLVQTTSKKAVKDQQKNARQAVIAAKREARQAAKNDLKNIDWSQVTTIARMKQILKAVIDKIDDEE